MCVLIDSSAFHIKNETIYVDGYLTVFDWINAKLGRAIMEPKKYEFLVSDFFKGELRTSD